MALPAETHVDRVRLRVGDVDRAESFYSGALGLRTLDRGGGVVTMSAGGETPLLELDAADSAGGPPAPPRSTGLFHVAYLYPSREALGRALARLAESHVQLTGAADHLVSEAVYCNDPDGNGIEIYRDRPQAQWPDPPPGQAVAIASIPLDVQEILDQAGPDEGGAAPGTVVGHVHLKVSDLAASVPFYRDALGLDLMASLGPEAAFLAAGGYHHHVGLNVWQSLGAGPPPPGSAGLAGFTFALGSADAVEAAAGALRAAGHEVETENGRASVRDPDGIAIRLESG